jgi:hypothetical protein
VTPGFESKAKLIRPGIGVLVLARFLILAAVLGACDSGGEAERQEGAVVATSGRAGPEGGDAADWLAPTDGTDPAVWLARREAGGPVSAQDARIAVLGQAFARARGRFVEDPRMIANRTAQLGTMLAEAGQPEDYATLITGLSAVAAAAGERKQLYGEMCQHYANTRRAGADRDTALARLTERYGAQDAR